MDDGFGGESPDEAAERRLREAQAKLDQPRVDALKVEMDAIKEYIQPEHVYGKESFLRQFRQALERAERFAEAMFPEPLP